MSILQKLGVVETETEILPFDLETASYIFK
jgi:hypothetical protein